EPMSHEATGIWTTTFCASLMADASTLKALRSKLGDLEDELDSANEAKAELEEQLGSLKEQLEASQAEALKLKSEASQAGESELAEARKALAQAQEALQSREAKRERPSCERWG
ncbi:unnamed protein product, partial [Effrenium voratum]